MPAADRPKRNRNPVNRDPFPLSRKAPEPTKSTGSWAPSRILTRTSAVAKADVQGFLLTCITGWDGYSRDEQRRIIDTLPKDRRLYVEVPATGKYACPLDAGFVVTDSHLKRAIARFKTDISEGNYTPSWQDKAQQAMKERAEGRFDDYVKQHAEDMFGDGGNDSNGGSVKDTEENNDSSARNQQQQQAHSLQDHSSDGEWGPSAKYAGSQSRRQGYKRKKAKQDHDLSRSTVPGESQGSRSRTTTPMNVDVDKAAW